MDLFERLKEKSIRIAEQKRLSDAIRGTGGTLSADQVALLSPEQQKALRNTAYDAGMRGTPSKTLAANYQAQQLNQVSQNLMAQINNSQLPEATKQGLRGMAMSRQFDKVVSALNPTSKERRIVKGADGFQYYSDTGERVLPNVAPKAKNPFEIKTADVVGAQKDERKTFQAANKGVKNFQQLLDAAQSADGAASYALMIKFIKQLDDSVVREGEVSTFGGFQGALENFRLYVNKAKGEGFTPAVKANMINLATQTANRLVEDYNTYRAGKAISYSAIGFKPDMIFAGLDFNLGDLDLTKEYTPEDFEFIEFE